MPTSLIGGRINSSGGIEYFNTTTGTTVGVISPSGYALKGYIPFNLAEARTLTTNQVVNLAGTGGIVALDSDPLLKRVNTSTDKALRLEWQSASVKEIVLGSFAYPPDLDDTAALTVNLLAQMKSGSVDTPTIAVSYFEGIGDTNAGGNTAALSTTLAQVSVTIAASDVGPYPTFATVGITPGTHGTASNDVYVYAAWIEYTRR